MCLCRNSRFIMLMDLFIANMCNYDFNGGLKFLARNKQNKEFLFLRICWCVQVFYDFIRKFARWSILMALPFAMYVHRFSNNDHYAKYHVVMWKLIKSNVILDVTNIRVMLFYSIILLYFSNFAPVSNDISIGTAQQLTWPWLLLLALVLNLFSSIYCQLNIRNS